MELICMYMYKYMYVCMDTQTLKSSGCIIWKVSDRTFNVLCVGKVNLAASYYYSI